MRSRFALAAAAAALALTGTLTGCSSSSPSSTGTGGGSQQLPAPVIVDVSKVGGTTVSVPLGNVIDVNVGGDVTKWSADVANPDIASFTKGRKDGSAEFNPGFEPVAAGSTGVTMTDGATKVSFTITVTK